MFFVLSKISYFFIAPINWIIALLVWRFFAKSAVLKKRLSVIIIAAVLFFGNEVIYAKLVSSWQAQPVSIDKFGTYEAGVLLGGLSNFDKAGRGFLSTSSDRLVETLALYQAKKIKKIIVSGGSVFGDRPKEADFLYKELLLLGVPAADLIIENNSRTTYENAVFTKKVVESLKLKPPFVLVTSALHIPRAERVFAKAGLQVVPFPADFRVIDKKFYLSEYLIPQLMVLNDWGVFLKEVVGIAGYKLFGKI
jgi:uncharacterized SAM-binding protein YcdF (DUF218 family)